LTKPTIYRDVDEAFPRKSLDDVKKSEEVSTNAIETAIEAENAVEDILDRLPQQSSNARQLRVTVNDMNKGVELTDNQCMELYRFILI